jgi:uncharacterized protein YjcR
MIKNKNSMQNENTMPRRRPGGQPGNQNAYKHGFYSIGREAELKALSERLKKAQSGD